jgi:hypothetical protein
VGGFKEDGFWSSVVFKSCLVVRPSQRLMGFGAGIVCVLVKARLIMDRVLSIEDWLQ